MSTARDEPASRDAGEDAGGISGGDPAPDFQAEIRDALAGLAARFDRELAREHERAAHREAVIDRLHEENQRLRRGELQATLEPLRSALYRLHDLARGGSERWAAPEPPKPADAASLLAAVADEVADALARTGVERFTVEPGEAYDATRHRPVAVEPVTDPALAGTVVAVRTDGFEQDGRVVRKAEVSVGKAVPEGPPAPSPPIRTKANSAAKPTVVETAAKPTVAEAAARAAVKATAKSAADSAPESAKSGTAGRGACEPLRETEVERDDERGPDGRPPAGHGP
ncbi:nucleotide exchange factor GrpE [Actinomadura rudentiformis]|uniref:Nucleotide exchange factor GrpE n=1 Tax=Actinomadura rudentiformis TaxID=359158 RepID=A0A6H9YKL6_9ACTN|nr:nucleotide exchange factor GrpE [Actinomadura rudentiformis]KAB2345075.1 nucleotide exchange factor GrpE [Actinomadura rudentiformis]